MPKIDFKKTQKDWHQPSATFAKENRLEIRGKHHEIYLSDPNRTPPAKLKTVLRQAVK